MINAVAYILDIPIVFFFAYVYMFFFLFHNGLTRKQFILIRTMILFSACLTVLEAVYSMISIQHINISYDWIYVIDTMYNFSIMLVSVIWCRVGFEFIKRVPFAAKAALYSALLAGAVFLTVQIGFKGSRLFVTVSDGQYHYGPLSYGWAVLCYAPLILLMITTGLNIFKKAEYANRDAEKPFFVFAIVQLLFGMLQLIYPFSFFVITGVGISAVYFYMALNASHILTDEATGLPNRRQAIKDADRLIKAKVGWSIISFYIDGREAIYKEFGIGEKDIINSIISKTLNRVCTEYDCKPYTYKGDRFLLICENDDSEYGASICNSVAAMIEELSLEKKVPYKIILLSDYLSIDPDTTLTVPDIIHLLRRLIAEKKKKVE